MSRVRKSTIFVLAFGCFRATDPGQVLHGSWTGDGRGDHRPSSYAGQLCWRGAAHDAALCGWRVLLALLWQIVSARWPEQHPWRDPNALFHRPARGC